jgi:hypothetical protein
MIQFFCVKKPWQLKYVHDKWQYKLLDVEGNEDIRK